MRMLNGQMVSIFGADQKDSGLWSFEKKCALKNDRGMPPEKKVRKIDEENFMWTDDEVKLLLKVVRSYSVQKVYEGLQWESVKSKYEDITKDFVDLYQQADGQESLLLLHHVRLFTRERIASKIKKPTERVQKGGQFW